MRAGATRVLCRNLVRAFSRNGNNNNNMFIKIHPISFPKYSTVVEMQPQTSAELIKIMEQRLSAIEQEMLIFKASLIRLLLFQKELQNLNDNMDLIRQLRTIEKDIELFNWMIDTPREDIDLTCTMYKELLSSSYELVEEREKEKQDIHNLLLKSLLPKDDADARGCILEVRAGTGGEEASLFAMDIFKMYERYSQKKGWRFEVVDVTDTNMKGLKEASAAISGADVYRKLKFESGVHRVERVPITEKSGLVHTSAVSVSILPQADEVDVQMRHEDLRIDTYRSGGSGGQHANTINSAVQITHIPSGLTVAIQNECSQDMNKAKALKVLCTRLYEMERCRVHNSRSKQRSEQIGSEDRSECIRTYNFPQGQVTDHRIGFTHHSISDMIQGESLDYFIDALLLQQQMDAIAEFSASSG